MNGQILVYNNQSGVVAPLEPLLMGDEYVTKIVSSRQEILDSIEMEEVKMLITDIELANDNGFELIGQIRQISPIPIMVLSARDDEAAKIKAFKGGADDYVVYPCSPLELLARVKAHIRRYVQLSSASHSLNKVYRFDDLVVNDVTRTVTVCDKEVKLTPIEYKILKLLVQEKGKVMSIEEIYESIWNMRAIGADNTIAVHIRHIREKIEENPKQPIYLKVVWGTGYKVG
ncbi:MAG: response regulator transcription factor [Lachnospiraceae bacterium]|nr:response regulator transcription factor [Lachnospiraceae bacterium]